MTNWWKRKSLTLLTREYLAQVWVQQSMFSISQHSKSNIEQKLPKCYSFGRCTWSSLCVESGMKQDYTKTNRRCWVGPEIWKKNNWRRWEQKILGKRHVNKSIILSTECEDLTSHTNRSPESHWRFLKQPSRYNNRQLISAKYFHDPPQHCALAHGIMNGVWE